jgi:hypothetical protein
LHAARSDAEKRAQHAARSEACVREVGAVFGGDQGFHQVRRDLGKAHQHAVLVAGGVDAAYGQRLEARQGDLAVFGVGKARQHAGFESETHPPRRLGAVPEHERTQRNVEALARA